MPGPVNTAGGEDSPFITPDGQEFYFFFTPDVRVPAEKQLLDSVTGIWSCRRQGGSWTEPERVILNDDIGLDGCQQLIGDTLWFASTRSNDMLGNIDVFHADTVRGGHAVCIVGYRDDGRFIVRNSWGTTWGDNGFGYLHPDYITAAFYNESYGVTL
jgi:hypothetical protein